MPSTISPDAPTTKLPIHPPTSKSNYASTQTEAQKTAAAVGVTKISIPDGRKNCDGEDLPSPTETWRPNLQRQQSWNQQDLKREFLMRDLETGKGGGTLTSGGFTEEADKK